MWLVGGDAGDVVGAAAVSRPRWTSQSGQVAQRAIVAADASQTTRSITSRCTSARTARQRDARLARQLARDHRDQRDLLQRKNGAGDPQPSHPLAREATPPAPDDVPIAGDEPSPHKSTTDRQPLPPTRHDNRRAVGPLQAIAPGPAQAIVFNRRPPAAGAPRVADPPPSGAACSTARSEEGRSRSPRPRDPRATSARGGHRSRPHTHPSRPTPGVAANSGRDARRSRPTPSRAAAWGAYRRRQARGIDHRRCRRAAPPRPDRVLPDHTLHALHQRATRRPRPPGAPPLNQIELPAATTQRSPAAALSRA